MPPDPSMFGTVPVVAERERLVVVGAANDEESAASRYRALFAAISDGFCVVEVILDERGTAVDHRFIEVNPAFEAHTGVRDAVGRLATELFPSLERTWFEVYGQVARTGQPVRLTREAKALARVFDVQAFRVDDPQWRHVGVLFSDITDRVRRDQALHASRQMLETVVDHIPAAVCVIRGSDLRLALVNPTYQAIAPGKVMLGKTLDELWPETGQDFRAICRKVLETGEAHQAIDDLNMIRRSPEGPLEAAYFTWSLHRIELPGDEGWGLLNAAWETTYRKQVEEAARASELRYRHLVEQVPDGIFVADGQGRYIDVNPAGCALLGMTRAEILSSSIADVTLPEEHHRIPDEVARFDHGAIARSEWKFRRKDGSIFIGEVTGRRNSEGDLQAILRDITESKKVDEALRESEQRFRLMVDDLPLIVWVHDAEGRLVFVNRTYCQYFGISAEQAYDGWCVLTHPDDGEAYAKEFLACLAERRSFHARVRVKRADGEWRWVESWGRPRVAGSEFLGIVGTSADVSKRMDVEAAMKEADRRKDEFLALLAHELRNPLAPLRNGLELLRLGKGNEEMAERARAMMGRQVSHMVRLIDDLLDVSRIARGKLELRREAVDLGDVVKSAIETSTPVMEAGRHDLQVDVPVGPLRLEADPVRLAQVLSNLLNNAARYTSPGGHIVLSAQRYAGEVRVRVEDNGVGIPSDMLEQVFEPFTQVETRTRQAHGGLGLGLSLARSLVEMHGGSISAQSAGEGRGSCFTVRLPLVLPGEDIALGSRSPASAHGVRRRILVVDDNQDAADSLSALLGLMGHDVQVAYGGPTAIETAVAFRPNVVLLDIGMPGMDGYEVAERIRARRLVPPPLVVALTGFGQDSDRVRSEQARFDGHLVKPVDPRTLEQVLAEMKPRSEPPQLVGEA